MLYQEFCTLPVRSYPLNGLPLFSLPGKRLVVRVIDYDGGGGITGKVQEDLYRWRKRDDKEILDIIMTIVLSGRL
ncbi:MAG: hypothetical protein IMF20_02345 [Proteobacteria bacterium]|nr:hypothetical protein [Pseudomonadota bacterium]